MFRRLEEEERPRIEEATLQLAAAEARMQERKARLQDQIDRQQELSDRSLNEQPLATLSTSFPSSPSADDSARTLKPGEWRTIGHESAVDYSAASTNQATVGAEPITSTAATPVANEPEPPTVAPAIANFLNSVDPYKRAAAVSELARSGSPDAFSRIAECFDDHSLHVRNAAARALRNLEPAKTVDLFNRALENASAERRRNIGAAIAASGMADEAIKNLGSDNREDTYNALSILFVMAKTGEVAPLVRALEVHGTNDIGKAVSKLLALSGHAQS
jgi:HEAT repeat protein